MSGTALPILGGGDGARLVVVCLKCQPMPTRTGTLADTYSIILSRLSSEIVLHGIHCDGLWLEIFTVLDAWELSPCSGEGGEFGEV